jgi:putrescine aminotransferase
MNQVVGHLLAQKDYRDIHVSRHMLPFENHLHLKPEHARVLVKGEGMYVWDDHGTRFLDAMSGLWCTAVGYGHPALKRAAAEQIEQLSFCSQYFLTTHPAVAELTYKLFELLPSSFGRVLYANSGSEVNDLMMRVVRRFWELAGKPEKRIIISRRNGYHGSTQGSAALSGFDVLHQFGALKLDEVRHIGEPYWYGYNGALSEHAFGLAAARELETAILAAGADNVAAFVAEPFQGAGGMIYPPQSYWSEIGRICRQYDVLLSVDEVVGGFGRTGSWFASNHFGIEPDTMSLAKGLTSGYIPMGALAVSRRIGDALAECGGTFAHGFTYQGHPVAAAVALANLRLLDEGGLVEQVAGDTGPYLQRCLRQRFDGHPIVGEVQGSGMIAALQLSPDPAARARFTNEDPVGGHCARQALERGLIVRSVAARMILAPALIATRAQIDTIIDKLGEAVDATARTIKLM